MRNLLTLGVVLFCNQLTAQNILASAELEAQNITKVEIDGSFCDVSIKKGDRNYLKARIVGRGDEGDFEFDTEIAGSTLIVRVIRKDRMSWRGYNLRESKIELTLKEGVEIDVDNSSGDVYVSGLFAKRSKIEASSGDITLREVESTLEVETSSGDVAIDGLIGSLDIKTTSGDQRIEDTKGAIKSIATSGDITIEGFDGEVTIEATSGDIELNDGVGKIAARTTAGDIEGDDITLNGDASFRASSGDVEIDFVNDVDVLSFDLTATSGNLEVGNKSGNKKLYIAQGGHKVIGVTSSGDQEYY